MGTTGRDCGKNKTLDEVCIVSDCIVYYHNSIEESSEKMKIEKQKMEFLFEKYLHNPQFKQKVDAVVRTIRNYQREASRPPEVVYARYFR